MLVAEPSFNNGFRPDIYQYTEEEYNKYKEKVTNFLDNRRRKKQNYRYVPTQEELIEECEKRDKEMLQHLLKTAHEIQGNVDKLGMFYHEGTWNKNKDILKFKGDERMKLKDSLVDLLMWYNLHENKKFKDS